MTDDYLTNLDLLSNQLDFDDLMAQNPMLLKILATRETTPPAILAKLACSDNSDIALMVASNPNTPSDVLTVLAIEKMYLYGSVEDSEIIQAVTANPSTPKKVLGKKIIEDSWGHINALKNDNSPLVSILDYLLSQIGADERGALNFNQRFSDLVRLAKKLDLEHTQGSSDIELLSLEDFDNDENDAVESWS